VSLLFPAAHDPDRHMRSGTMTRVFYPARQAAGHAAAKLTETSNARHYDVPRRNHHQARDNRSLIPICAATGADVGAHKLLPSALTATPTAAALHHEARLPLVDGGQNVAADVTEPGIFMVARGKKTSWTAIAIAVTSVERRA
jgi:hypothetical protein